MSENCQAWSKPPNRALQPPVRAPHDHMEKAFAQRREQVVGDLVQLKTDVDVYNDMKRDKATPTS